MKCPHCDVETNPYKFENISASKCPICFMVVIEKNELMIVNQKFTELFEFINEEKAETDYHDYFKEYIKSNIKIDSYGHFCRNCNERMKKIYVKINKNKFIFEMCILCNSVVINSEELLDLIKSIDKINLGLINNLYKSPIYSNPILRNLLYPLYNEMTLYLTTLSLLYVFIIDHSFRELVLKFSVIFALYTSAFLLSIYYAFSKKIKG